MSLVASQYSEEDERSKIMGFVLGSIALGVLLGYPIGSVLYDLEGKMAPFLLVSSLIIIVICNESFFIKIIIVENVFLCMKIIKYRNMLFSQVCKF